MDRSGEERRRQGRGRRTARAVALTISSLVVFTARADDAATDSRWRLGAEAATSFEARAARVVLGRDDLAVGRLGPLRVAGGAEANLGIWHVKRKTRYNADGEDGRSTFAVGGVSGFVRLGEASGPFVQIGTGPHAIAPRYRNRDRRFGTVFNFGSHVGGGWRFAGERAVEVALRVEHFSNAGIRQPNPGANFFQLRLGAAF